MPKTKNFVNALQSKAQTLYKPVSLDLLKKDSSTDVFPVNLAQIFRTVFLQNTSGQHEFTIEKN